MPDDREDRNEGAEQESERNRNPQQRPDQDDQGQKADAPRTGERDTGTQDRGVERSDWNYEDAEQQEDRTGQRSRERRGNTSDEG